jgi:formyl-CoA transferase
MRDSGALVPIDDPRAGARLTVSSPVWMGGQDKVPAAMAPGIGEHTTEVLREAGLEATEIARLLQAGVIAQGKPD